MTDLALIQSLAERCRCGLQQLAGESSSMFYGFPSASCGPAAEIVGRIMKEDGGFEGRYVCGTVHPRLRPSQSHAWFEVGVYLIDITHDQFENTGLTGWVFKRGTGWHSEFEHLDPRDGFCMPSGWPAYPFDGYSAIASLKEKIL